MQTFDKNNTYDVDDNEWVVAVFKANGDCGAAAKSIRGSRFFVCTVCPLKEHYYGYGCNHDLAFKKAKQLLDEKLANIMETLC